MKIKKLLNRLLTINQIVYYKLAKELPDLSEYAKGNWIDLRVPGHVKLLGFVPEQISLGLTMFMPNEVEASMLPRSSTPKNFGIVLLNSQGVIDDTYRGLNDVWSAMVMTYKTRSEFGNGDRAFQFRLSPAMNASPLTKIKFLFTRFHFVRINHRSYEHLCKKHGVVNRGGDGQSGIR